MGSMLGFVSASVFSISLAFAGENHDLSLLRLIHQHKRLLKKLRKLAKNTMNEIWSLDECHFQQHGSRCTMWVPPEEKDPVVLHAPTKKSISLFGAVNVSSGKLVNLITPVFNAETFRQFIKMLIKRGSKKKRLIVILDNARYHHALILKPWLDKNRKRIEFLFLPPYSPELNPIERVWKMVRKNCTHNQYFPSLECLVKSVKEQLNLWGKPNVILHKLCCII